MKILITAPSLDTSHNVSGISTVVRQVIEHANAEFYHFLAGREDRENFGINWILKQTTIVPHFLRQLRREKIDVVHINTALNPLSIVRDFALTMTARMARKPVLLHLHGGRFLAEDFQSETLAHLAKKMLQKSDAVVVLSKIEKRIIERRWQNLNVKVLENAVSLDEIPDIKRNRDEKTLIFLGRLHESKGLHEIVKACRALKKAGFEFRFRCFGAGALKDFFIAEMTEILGEKFFYGGIVSGAEKREELAKADIFLLPSRYGEGLPMAMLEAMAAQCVVIVSEMASVGEVVKDGINGFLVAPQNVSQLIEKLKLILSKEIDLEMIEKNARKTVEEKFNLNDYIEKLEKIYGEIKR